MKRIIEIDILRSLATLLLLIHHAGIYQFEVYGFTLKYLLRTQIGFSLLGLFVFLSGFLLGKAIRHNPHLKLRSYYARRVVKLYPPYIVSLILFQALLSVQLDGLDFWIHLFGLQVLLAPAFSVPILTLWYFSLLILCLMIVPLALVKFKRASRSALYLSAAFILAYILHEQFQIIEIRFFYFFWIFSLGGLIGRYYLHSKKVLMHPASLIVSAIVLVLTGYRLFKSQSVYVADIHWGHISWANAYMLSFIHLAFVAATRLKRIKGSEKIVQLISRGSYFTYIYHRPVWQILLFPLSIPEGPITFLIRFFVGSPLVIYLSGKLQSLYEGIFAKSITISEKRSS